ncbi:MAG: UvrD-helicase domain-containing protein [Acidobacteria bacterium]|nr:UvrD-helicase domain-containing protein [Acidobacteriota bacterium]
MDFLGQLNPRQREAVEHTEGPLLILAGAGSGKTRVITYRIAHLIRNNHVPPSRLLAVTFTNKAAEEMRDRVAILLGGGSSPAPDGTLSLPWVSTFHSFAVRLLRREGGGLEALRQGFTARFSIYDEADQVAVLKAVYRQLGLDEKFLPYRSAAARISHAKNQGIAPEHYYGRSTNPQDEKLAVIYEQYEAALRRANALDFDDLLLEAVRLLRHDEQARARAVDRFHYLMVDEYQDTNRVQYDLVRLLTEPRRNLCVVGDEDQSIYGWRGADIRNILDFERDYPGATLIRLEQNYRSTKNILDAAGQVVSHNLERKGKELWTTAGPGSKILLYRGEDAENEALFIAACIEKHLRQNPSERAAVLYRTNFQSRQIEEALRRYGRSYLLVGGLSFYQRAEVKDLLAYLKAAVSPQDSYSLLRIINTPARGIGKSTVELIARHTGETGLSLWASLEDLLARGSLAARSHAALAGFQSLMKDLRAHLGSGPLHQALVWLLDTTGYRKMLEQEGTIESQGRLENIDELVNAAADAGARGETVEEFLDHAALVADTDDLDEAAQVTLLTLHMAKGLEFSLVIMAGMEEGLFPHSRSADTASGLEEERRLCYVGMTRAQKQLVLTLARSRRRFGGGELEPGRPSRFLREVPARLLEEVSPFGVQLEEGVDLYTERHEVQEIARHHTFTGKTYNSVENIAEFFAARGIPTPAAAARRTAAEAPARAQVTPIRGPTPKAAGGFRAGARVHHPKYGTGTVLRKEGEGDDAKLTVSFPYHGIKKLIQKYATLRQE